MQSFLIYILIIHSFIRRQNEDVETALMELDWTLLPIENVKTYQTLMIKAQNSITLTAGGLKQLPINMALFQKVCVYKLRILYSALLLWSLN